MLIVDFFFHLVYGSSRPRYFFIDAGYVRGSPNGKIFKSTDGTVGTIFTNGNQKTLNVFCCQWYHWYQWNHW